MKKKILTIAAGLVLAATVLTSCNFGNEDDRSTAKKADSTVTTPTPPPTAVVHNADSLFTIVPYRFSVSDSIKIEHLPKPETITRDPHLAEMSFAIHILETADQPEIVISFDESDYYERNRRSPEDTDKIYRVKKDKMKAVYANLEKWKADEVKVSLRRKFSEDNKSFIDEVEMIYVPGKPQRFDEKRNKVIEATKDILLYQNGNLKFNFDGAVDDTETGG